MCLDISREKADPYGMEKNETEAELLRTLARLLVNRRWAKTTRKERQEYARKMARARWGKKLEKKP